MVYADPAAPAAPPSAAEIQQLFAGAMPKQEIGATAFLKKHPAYDGRGVIVAIFDTGVDPGATGLQETTDGKPKILDILDGTGSGDVDISQVVEAAPGDTIKGIFGNDLKLHPDWTNPSGKWHIGAKNAFELFPGGLKKRISKERRKAWDREHQAAVAAVTEALASGNLGGVKSEKDASPEATQRYKLLKGDWEARLELLEATNDKHEDLGPRLDAVVWNDGTHNRVAIDTSDMYELGSEEGLLADFTPLTDFDIERQFGTFSAVDACNFGVHVYPDSAGVPEVLSIIVDAGSHGTHVAGITAAHHPNDPVLNGIAPGAQIISCKIGDSRLGSMETIVGLSRALGAVLQHGAHVINMSYGEPTATPNIGRFIELASEVVHKHGVIFVSSAGNAGPALSTVGAPGGTSSAILSIGAYVSPDMAAASHSVRGAMAEGQQYTWSSRGPTDDGYPGVTLSAPGGAIAPVPQWTQQSRQLMNGTSMASPNACGGVALLLSGLKAAKLAYSPATLRRALENTCAPVSTAADAALTYGCGLMQVHRAFEYFEAFEETTDVRYEVRVKRSDSAVWQRGIYLREPLHGSQPMSFTVEVLPKLHEDADTKTERLAVEDRLVIESTGSWLDAPSSLLLPHNGRTFEVKVDPRQAPPGLSCAQVHGIDATRPGRGPLFRVFATLIRPETFPTISRPPFTPLAVQPSLEAAPVNSNGASASGRQPGTILGEQTTSEGAPKRQNGQDALHLGRLAFGPGTEVRRFVAIPEGATWAELILRAGEHDTPRLFMVRATQLLPHTRHSDTEARGTPSLAAGQEAALRFRLVAGGTLEVTLSQFWSSLGQGDLDVSLSFHGLEARCPGGGAFLDGSHGNLKVLLRCERICWLLDFVVRLGHHADLRIHVAPFRAENINPSAKLTAVQVPLRPVDSALAPMRSARDLLPGDRTAHSLLLTYKFSVTEAGKHKPILHMLNRYVYDGELEAQFYMLFDSNKRLLGQGDIYPEAVQLKKGDYVLRVFLRHDSATLLGQLKTMPVIIERQLGDPISVPVYATNNDAIKRGATVKERALFPGERAAVFVGPVPEEKLPKDATPGRVLVGKLVVAKLPKAAGSGDAPGAVPFTFTVPPKAEAASKASDDTPPAPPKEPPERLSEALRDAKVKFLGELKTGAKEEAKLYEQLQAELLKEYPKHEPLLLERLRRLDSGSSRLDDLQAIIDAAQAVRDAIDTDVLARTLVTRSSLPGDVEAVRKRKEAEGQRASLTDALHRACLALLDLSQKAAGEEDKTPAQPEEPKDDGQDEVTVGSPAPEGATTQAQPGHEKAIQETYAELCKWADINDVKYAVLQARMEASQGRHAAALRALDKAINADDKPPSKELFALRAARLKALGWHHMHRAALAAINNYFPPGYPLF